MRASPRSRCDDGRSTREVQIVRSLRRVRSKVIPLWHKSRTYDGFSGWRLEFMRRKYFVQVLNDLHQVIGLEALDILVKFPPTENIIQLTGKLGRRLVQPKQGLEVTIRIRGHELVPSANGSVEEVGDHDKGAWPRGKLPPVSNQPGTSGPHTAGFIDRSPQDRPHFCMASGSGTSAS